MRTCNLLFLLPLVFFMACKKNDPLKGIDKQALFAAPAQAELAAVEEAWKMRDLRPLNINIEATHEIYKDKLYLKIISFTLYGLKQYAGVLVPVTPKPLPVRLFVYGFSLEDPVTYQNLAVTDSISFLYVIPALRGQSLSITVNGVKYTTPVSEGTRNDAFDGATDDAIACLNAVITTFSEADAEKVVVRGGSRGGTVALLMGIRDKRVKMAVGVAFPPDLLTATAGHQNDDTYRFQFLDVLINGTATINEVRKKMIASSPMYFYQLLPKIQMHFGENDKITPAAQGAILFDKMKAAGMGSSVDYFIYNNREHANIGTNNAEMETRISLFFDQL